MPKAKHSHQIELARTLYINGMRPKLIATQLGIPYNTIQTWRTRYAWTQTQRDAIGELSKANMKLAAEKLAEQSIVVRDKLAQDILSTIDNLPAVRRDNIRHWLVRMRGVQAIVDNAAKVFGWGDSTSKGTALVRIDLSTVKQVPSPSTMLQPAPKIELPDAIDVEPGQ